MLNDHTKRIKKRIQEAILLFKSKKIDHIDLINTLQSNIEALDNLDQSVKEALITLSGEIETILYMESPKNHFEYMLKEVDKFEPFLDRI